ncbi:MAG: 4-hydroxy-tetrahydrodipicolinate synthase [Ferrimicrobium sp.]
MSLAFGRVLTAMATPFSPDGSIDFAAVERLATWLESHGSEALVVTGSTGESGTLSDGERRDLWGSVKACVQIPVIAGATTNDTAHSLRLVRDAMDVGVDGVLAVTPYYNRPPQAGLLAHFGAIAVASELPVILYDIPARTGRRIERETIWTLLSRYDTVVGVKDASGDVTGAAQLVADAPRAFTLWSGDDALTLPFMSIGAVGVVSVAAHWAGPEFGEMVTAAAKGEMTKAQEINRTLLPSYSFETSDLWPNPIPLKVMLAELGLCASECRSPLIEGSEELRIQAKAVLNALRGR